MFLLITVNEGCHTLQSHVAELLKLVMLLLVMFILLHLFPLYEDKHFFLEFYIAKEMLTHHIFMTSSHFICIFGITPVYLPNSNSCATEVFIINKAE